MSRLMALPHSSVVLAVAVTDAAAASAVTAIAESTTANTAATVNLAVNSKG